MRDCDINGEEGFWHNDKEVKKKGEFRSTSLLYDGSRTFILFLCYLCCKRELRSENVCDTLHN